MAKEISLLLMEKKAHVANIEIARFMVYGLQFTVAVINNVWSLWELMKSRIRRNA